MTRARFAASLLALTLTTPAWADCRRRRTAATPDSSRLTAQKAGSRQGRGRAGEAGAGDGGLGVQLRRARLAGGRDVEVPHRPAREVRLQGARAASPGIPTAWVATWGSGKPVIALGSDIDGIPQASQKPGVAYHDPIIEGAPGHGEGHNTGMPLNIVAAIAVKQIMERDKLPGTLMLWPGVAEELVASKAWFVRDGHVQGRRRQPLHARRQQPRRVVGRRRRQRPGVGRVHLRGRDRAQRRRAVARPLGARRRGADERRAGTTAASTCGCRSARTP